MTRTMIFFLAALLAAPAAAQGVTASTATLSAAAPPVALLWIPREDTLDWDQLQKLGADFPSLHVTVALSPKAYADAPDEITAALPPGFELALRLSGDPVLPLIEDLQSPALGIPSGGLPAFSRPEDAIARLADLRSGYADVVSTPPAGFAPEAGALTADMLPLLRPFSIAWVAVGPPVGTSAAGPFKDASGTVYLPFRTLDRDAPVLPSSAPAAFVLDDTTDPSLSYTSSGIRTLRALAASPALSRLTTVADYLKDPAVAAAEVALSSASPVFFAPWTGTGYAPWVDQPLKRAAWDRLALAAKLLDQSQATVTPARFETASNAFLEAEAGRTLLNLDSRLPDSARDEAERELRISLSEVARLLDQPLPEALQQPLEQEAQGPSLVDSGPDWVLFKDPFRGAGVPARLPPGLDSATASQVWDLDSLKVSWDTAAVTFSVQVSTAVNPLNAPGGFSYLMFDVYVDVNHRAGAGLTSLLPGRDAMTEAADAWEFALTATGWGARLYRAGADGEIIPVGTYAPVLDAASGTISVSIPTSVLRGNPKGWGYVVASMALDPSSATQDVGQPLPDAEGDPLLDVLSPWLSGPPGQAERRRLQAVRLE